MHVAPDPVPHQLTHHPEAGRLGQGLDRVADVADVVAYPCLLDAGGETSLGDIQQPLCFCCWGWQSGGS